MTGSQGGTRRNFLKILVKTGFTSLFAIFGLAFLRFLYPSVIKKREVKFYYALEEEYLPTKGVKRVDLSFKKDEKVMAFRTFLVAHEKNIFALSAVCTHLGCLVDWSGQKGRFFCPCHGGGYDISGNVIAGPPPAPLSKIPLKIENGKVYMGIAT
jgi:Rieske Fe-S protein